MTGGRETRAGRGAPVAPRTNGGRCCGRVSQDRLLAADSLDELGPRGRREEPVGQVETVHGVARVDGEAAVLGRDAGGRELLGQGSAAHEEGDVDAGAAGDPVRSPPSAGQT